MCLRIGRRNHPAFALLEKYRYAHRGLHCIEEGIPENTLPAFERAIAHGCGAELDVHFTADKQLVVIHDSNLKRLCGVDLIVEDLTLAELQSYGILGTDLTAPLFEEVLKLFQHRTPLIVEVKTLRGNADALTAAVCAMLDRYPVDYCVESFDPFSVRWLRRHRPEICRGQLSDDFMGSDAVKGRILQYAASNVLFNFITYPDFVAYNVEKRNCRAVSICRNRYHVREVSWTIRSQKQLDEAESAGCIPIFERFMPE